MTAHARVSEWLTEFEAAYPDKLEILHQLPGGALTKSDLLEVLAASKPREKRAPLLPSPEKRVQRPSQATSFAAAISQTPERAQQLYDRLHATYSALGGLTDEEMLDTMKKYWDEDTFTPSGVRSRRAELVEAGWVVDSGVKRLTAARKSSIVWRLADSR